MLVCLGGHVISRIYEGNNRGCFCNKCGNETIFKCLTCHAPILGQVRGGFIVSKIDTPPPLFCDKCGTAFPWADKLGKGSEQNFSTDTVLNQIFTNFHRVTRQLRQRHDNQATLDVQNEYDVQDLLHSLLCLYFDDIRPEEWCPSYGGAASRTDFLLKTEQLFIEVKMTRHGLKDKEVGEQLIVDIERYKTHPDCKKLICFVYDPQGYVKNPTGLENDLSRTEGTLPVQVIITPKH